MPPNPSGFFAFISLCAICGCGRESIEPTAGQLAGSSSAQTESVRQDRRDRSIVPKAHARAAPVYATDVAPLFEKYCLNCHDAAAAEGGIVLEDSRTKRMRSSRRS